jgi:large subunit ribosomal protein L18
MKTSDQLRLRRKARQRQKIIGTSKGKQRLVVHRTNNHIYAQILSENGKSTVVHVSTLTKDYKELNMSGANKDAAVAIGKMLATKAKALKISEVIFDRSGFLYHGKIKALADSARENGLKF